MRKFEERMTTFSGDSTHSLLYDKIISHLLKRLSSKRQEIIRMWRKGNPCTLLVEMYTDAATMKNSMEILQNIQNRTTI